MRSSMKPQATKSIRLHKLPFPFWRRSAAVTAASSDGVSPFETTRGGDAPSTRRRGRPMSQRFGRPFSQRGADFSAQSSDGSRRLEIHERVSVVRTFCGEYEHALPKLNTPFLSAKGASSLSPGQRPGDPYQNGHRPVGPRYKRRNAPVHRAPLGRTNVLMVQDPARWAGLRNHGPLARIIVKEEDVQVPLKVRKSGAILRVRRPPTVGMWDQIFVALGEDARATSKRELPSPQTVALDPMADNDHGFLVVRGRAGESPEGDIRDRVESVLTNCGLGKPSIQFDGPLWVRTRSTASHLFPQRKQSVNVTTKRTSR